MTERCGRSGGRGLEGMREKVGEDQERGRLENVKYGK